MPIWEIRVYPNRAATLLKDENINDCRSCHYSHSSLHKLFSQRDNDVQISS